MRAVHTVGHKRYRSDGLDAHGNSVKTWEQPVDLRTYGIAPTESTADPEPGADRMAVFTRLTLYAPAGAEIGPHDRIVVDGTEYEVDGEVRDYSRGPFGFRGGLAVLLKRVEG